MTVLITAKDGQLGRCFQSLSHEYQNINFIFKSSKELDITNKNQVNSVLANNSIDFCINCAAYTSVDNAENQKETAYAINVSGSHNLAKACLRNQIVLIHISTDFVFDGNSNKPYSETNETSPINVYGDTKLKGEELIAQTFTDYFIVRTSWLYSEFGNNFLITMLKLAESKKEISVVSDQIGTPTYAKDLAEMILKLISEKKAPFGIYHYSNEGVCSWFDFAKEIFNQTNNSIKLNRIKTKDYPTLAKRPKYSVLDKSKIKHTLGIEIPNWKISLKKALSILS